MLLVYKFKMKVLWKYHKALKLCFFNNYIYLFIFGCAGPSLLCGLFPNCSEWELLPSCSAWVSHCGGLFCGAWDLGHVVFSSCSVWAPEHRLNVMVHRLSSSMACGIFQEQGWNLYLLPMDFLPLNLRAVPETMFYIKNPSVHFCVLACLIRERNHFFSVLLISPKQHLHLHLLFCLQNSIAFSLSLHL